MRVTDVEVRDLRYGDKALSRLENKCVGGIEKFAVGPVNLPRGRA